MVPTSHRSITAYHEAGHAVAAAMKGVKFRYVTTIPRDGATGHLFCFRQPRNESEVHHHGVVDLAGEAAQRRFSPGSVRRYHMGGDYEAVVNRALSQTGSSAQASLMAKLWAVQARDLVKTQWVRVELVAEALLARQKLTQTEVMAIIFGSGTRPLQS